MEIKEEASTVTKTHQELTWCVLSWSGQEQTTPWNERALLCRIVDAVQELCCLRLRLPNTCSIPSHSKVRTNVHRVLRSKSCDLNNQWTVSPGAMTSGTYTRMFFTDVIADEVSVTNLRYKFRNTLLGHCNPLFYLWISTGWSKLQHYVYCCALGCITYHVLRNRLSTGVMH